MPNSDSNTPSAEAELPPEQEPTPTAVPQPAPPPAAPASALAVVIPMPPTAAAPAAPSEKSGFWARPGWLALTLALLLGVVLSTALSLGTLAIANHGLRYASPSDVLALQARLDALEAHVTAQDEDLAGLRARLEAVEKLAARTSTLEQAAQNLRTELEKRGADLETLRGVVSTAQKQIEQVIVQSSAFETFIGGMRSLLEKIPLPGGTKP